MQLVLVSLPIGGADGTETGTATYVPKSVTFTPFPLKLVMFLLCAGASFVPSWLTSCTHCKPVSFSTTLSPVGATS